LPSTPSRTVPVQFGTRILTGALSGAAIAAPGGSLALGAIAGVVGAVIGTLGGPRRACRSGQDIWQRPAHRVRRGRGGDWRRGADRGGAVVMQVALVRTNDLECNGRGATANRFEIVAANLLDGKQRKVRDRRHASTDAGSSSQAADERVEPGDRIRLRARAER
jgi:hypothetical protein